MVQYACSVNEGFSIREQLEGGSGDQRLEYIQRELRWARGWAEVHVE